MERQSKERPPRSYVARWNAFAIVRLDVAYEEGTVEEALDLLVGPLDVWSKVVDRHGPGGGWPVVEFRCRTRDDLERLLRRYDGEEGV